MARKVHRVPKAGKLEQDVDAILLGQGLQLDASVEKVLSKSRRARFVPAKKGQRPPAAKRRKRRKAPKARPARGKQLRAARRKGVGK